MSSWGAICNCAEAFYKIFLREGLIGGLGLVYLYLSFRCNAVKDKHHDWLAGSFSLLAFRVFDVT